MQKLSVYSEEFDSYDALNNEKAQGVQASVCDFKLRPDQENKLKLELHALF